MQHIKEKLELTLYGYDANEFMPVFYEGKLENKGEFVAYKASRAFIRFSDAFDRLRAASQ
jgi:hypothetical protein